jgi:Mg2+-importing ATPase
MLGTLKRRIGRLTMAGASAKSSESYPGRAPVRVIEEASRELDTVLLSLGTTSEGISRIEADHRRGKEGSNEVAHERPPGWYVQLLMAFKNPFILLLLALAVLSYLTEDVRAAVTIAVMVLISVLLRFEQEYRSGRAAERLKSLVGTTATVSRPDSRRVVPEDVTAAFGVTLHPGAAQWEETPIRDLVRGDVIRLSAGDMVPADVRVLSSKDLFISQSVLTGESLPVEKHDLPKEIPAGGASSTSSGAAGPLDLPNICFMGSNVVSGTAKAVVIGHGRKDLSRLLGPACRRQEGPDEFR